VTANTDLYRGLRVRMGVHCGEPRAERDPTTTRFDYFGPMVTLSHKVAKTTYDMIVLSGQSQCARGGRHARRPDHRLAGMPRNSGDVLTCMCRVW
jgi:class 3 adenylate cyclase